MWTASLLLLAAGCQTPTLPPVQITEAVVSTPPPIVMSSPIVQAPPSLATNPPPPPPVLPPVVPLPLSVTNPPPSPILLTNKVRVAVTNSWISFEDWCRANGLGRPQKLGPNQYAVSSARGVLSFQVGSQSMRWDGTSVWLGFAPRYLAQQPHLHGLDVIKTLEPLLHRPAAPGKPSRVIVIDPGHGGSDGGTHGTSQQLEKTFTLDWAIRIANLLQTNGWRVYLTRTADVDVPLTNRVALADRVGADLFISLHFNGLEAGPSHSGIETFCTTPVGMSSTVRRYGEDHTDLEYPNNTFDRENLPLAFRLHREVLTATHAADGGVRHARFITVLREQRRPAVLIEGGFLSNRQEAQRVATPAYRQKLAEAVVKGLE